MALANRLTQLTIKFISLVPAGANRRELVAKGDGGWTLQAEIRKLDDERREATSVVYPVGEVDTQGDFMTEADFDAAMADFMAKGRTAAGKAADVDHDEQPTGDYFVEAWKIQPKDPRFPDDAGAWAVTRKVVDDARWEAIKAGAYKAFSFGGTAVRIPDQLVSKSAGLAEWKRVAVAVGKGLLADALTRRELPNLIDAACWAMWDAFYGAPANTDDERAAVAEVVAELTTYLSKSNKESGMDKSILKRLGDSVAELFRKAAEEPEVAPAKTGDGSTDLVAEAVEAAKAEQAAAHAEALEALKAEHAAALEAKAAELAEKDEKIAELEKAAPASGRIDTNGAGDGVTKTGGWAVGEF